jgi:hypothetical protein
MSGSGEVLYRAQTGELDTCENNISLELQAQTIGNLETINNK